MSMALFSWGFGKYGQLGNGQAANAELPQSVQLPGGARATALSCGAHFTLVLCARRGKSAQVLACGWGKHGRLGTGSEEDSTVPIETLLEASADIIAISAGHWHGCCVGGDGTLFAWGYNKSHGVLGLPAPGPPLEPVPRRVWAPGLSFKHVSCGYNYSFSVTASGQCYSWGCGRHGVLGHGDDADRAHPTLVETMKEKAVAVVSCGYSHAALVESGGVLHTLGSGKDGALGRTGPTGLPQPVEALAGVRVVDASCTQGEHHAHSLACSAEGVAYAWGDGYKGKLGLGSLECHTLPQQISPSHFQGQRVTGVACGGIHSAAVTAEGCVFTWGCGSDGRLGHPEARGHRYLFRSDVPRQVEGLPPGAHATAVSCSYYHTAVLCQPTK